MTDHPSALVSVPVEADGPIASAIAASVRKLVPSNVFVDSGLGRLIWRDAIAAASATREEAPACNTCGGKGYTEHEGGEGEGYPSRPEIEACSCRAQPQAREDAQPVEGRGHRHTAIMDAIHSELMRQFPGALTEEDGNATLAIHVTKPFMTIDVSSLAEVALDYPASIALRVAVEALEPFALAFRGLSSRWEDHETHWQDATSPIAVEDLRRADQALAALQAEQGAK